MIKPLIKIISSFAEGEKYCICNTALVKTSCKISVGGDEGLDCMFVQSDLHKDCPQSYSTLLFAFEGRDLNTLIQIYLTLPKRQILDSSKLKVYADDNFKLYENGKKLSKWVEKHCGKRRNCLI